MRVEVFNEKKVDLKGKNQYQKAIAFSLRIWHSETNLILELDGLRVQFGRISMPSCPSRSGGWRSVGRLGDSLYDALRTHFIEDSSVYGVAVKENLVEPLLPSSLLPLSGKSKKKKD